MRGPGVNDERFMEEVEAGRFSVDGQSCIGHAQLSDEMTPCTEGNLAWTVERRMQVSKLALVVTMEVRPGEMEAVLKAAKAHAARSLSSEPGTLQFDVLVPVNEDNELMLYEMYVDEAAFEVHRNGASMAIVQKDLEGKVDSTSVVRCAVQE
jgi:quinol monooxygenase YgiN